MMLYTAQSPFPLLIPEEICVAESFLPTVHMSWSFTGWLSPSSPALDCGMLPGGAVALEVTAAASSNLHPSSKSQAIQIPHPCEVQLLRRPEATTKTSSGLCDSQASPSHALHSLLSPWTPRLPTGRLGGWSADHMTAWIPRTQAGIVHFSLKSQNPG